MNAPKAPPKRCRRCEWKVDEQVFTTPRYEYHVGNARKILKASPRRTIELPPVRVYESVREVQINMRHVEHVNVRYPVIAVPTPEGGFLIIDGTHRAWARLFRRLPIRAHVLTYTEALLIRKDL